MIPSFIKTGLITGLVLFLCVLDSGYVGAAPVYFGTNVHEDFYQWLDQQPEPDSATSLRITPSGSFIKMGHQLLYTPGVDVSAKLKESALAAGYELSHTLLLSLVLKLALWANPVIPIYSGVSFSVDWYRFLRLWKSRLLLAWVLADWGINAISEAIWPLKKQVILDLSSSATGTVIGELDIPVDKTRPIELNIYTDANNEEEFKGCNGLTAFDCLISSFRTMGVHRWKLQWMHDAYEVNQWLFKGENEPLAIDPVTIEGVFNRTRQSDGMVHDIAGILSALFSRSLLQSTLDLIYPENPAGHWTEGPDWSGEHSAFISLGCQPGQECSGLYVAEEIAPDSVFVKRMSIDAGTDQDAFPESFDVAQAGVILNRHSRLSRIPESVVTVAFEILEELIEELGYQAVEAIATSPVPGPELPGSTADSYDEVFFNSHSETDPPGADRNNRVSLDAFNDLIEKGLTSSIPRLNTLAGMLDDESIKQGYYRAIELNYLDIAEELFRRLPGDWARYHLKQVVRRPAEMNLKKIVQLLPEHHLLFAMMEACNYGLSEAAGLLNTFASDSVRDQVILHAAHRGRTDIVNMLLPDRTQDVLHMALNKAHYSGYLITRDLIFDHLDAVTIKQKVKPDIFKGRLVRALEADDMDRVEHLAKLVPPVLSEILPVLMLRRSSEQTERMMMPHAANNVQSDKQGDEITAVLKLTGGMIDVGREEFLRRLIRENKQPSMPVVFNTLTPRQKVICLLDRAKNGERAHLELLMKGANPVTRDQVLLESVRAGYSRSVIVELARHSDQPSIRRAAICAAKTGLPAEARMLENFLPQEPPVYHLNKVHKALYKNELRMARNHKLGRRELGEKFYVYQQGKTAQMLYVIAHGEELPLKPFRHTGNYQLSFMAPDGHMLRTNHIQAYLERCFVPQEIIGQGQPVKEYGLNKNYNSGWAFKRMHSDCGGRNDDLMERKATPAVISEVRKHFARAGVSTDFLMVRGKTMVYLSGLLQEVDRAEWATYKQVIVGCCRGGAQNSPVFSQVNPLTNNYLTYAPDLFMKVANYLKVHPAFWDSPLWEYFHPDAAPEVWLDSLESHHDRMVSSVRKNLKDVAEKARKKPSKLQSSVARH